jgi:hypothetical protein
MNVNYRGHNSRGHNHIIVILVFLLHVSFAPLLLFFSCSTDTSVGSNCNNSKDFYFKKEKNFSSVQAYLPLDTTNFLFTIQPLVKLAHTSSTYFRGCQSLLDLHFTSWRGPPAARAIFCSRFFSFSDILFILASRATFRGS